MSLDDVENLRRIDRSDTLSIMGRTPSRLMIPVDANSTCDIQFKKPANVVFGGVGGSGIVGDVLSDYCRGTVEVPVSVCRIPIIPKFVSRSTLFVAISYSGETRETLGQLDQAKRKGAQIVIITSGGQLLSRAEQEDIAYLRAPAGLLPRIALPELVGATIFALSAADLLRDSSGLLAGVQASVQEQVDGVKPTVPFEKNLAKQLAQILLDRIPLLIGDEDYGSVLRRFKNELNENSKMPAFSYYLPEGYHDDIEGLRTLSQLGRVQAIMLRGAAESEGQKRTRERLSSLLGDLGLNPKEFETIGSDKLSQLLTAITFGDYVSVYLAALRGLDPAELTLIPGFRAAMRGE
jgi:glucose/mannose-6-phosphate isomerase